MAEPVARHKYFTLFLFYVLPLSVDSVESLYLGISAHAALNGCFRWYTTLGLVFFQQALRIIFGECFGFVVFSQKNK